MFGSQQGDQMGEFSPMEQHFFDLSFTIEGATETS